MGIWVFAAERMEEGSFLPTWGGGLSLYMGWDRQSQGEIPANGKEDTGQMDLHFSFPFLCPHQ